MPREFGRCATAIMAIAVAALLGGCGSSTADGDDVAAAEARAEAEAISEQIGHIDRVRDVEYFVDALFAPAAGRTSGAVPVAWDGRVGATETATIDVRITAVVDAHSAVSIGDRSYGAGRAVECFRYTLELYRYTSYESIACTDDPAPPLPTPAAIDTLPADAEQRLYSALSVADGGSLNALVRAAFPEPFVTVETTEAGGELIAAVGVPAERDCIVVVRKVDGTLERVSFDRVWIEPGELGCSVQLYTSPPL